MQKSDAFPKLYEKTTESEYQFSVFAETIEKMKTRFTKFS